MQRTKRLKPAFFFFVVVVVISFIELENLNRWNVFFGENATSLLDSTALLIIVYENDHGSHPQCLDPCTDFLYIQ